MGGIADIPFKVGRPSKIGILQWIAIVTTSVLLCAVSWGLEAGDFIHVGIVDGLDVQAEFLGYSGISDSGEFTYEKGEPLIYKIKILNRANRPVSGFRIQSSLHSDGARCEGSMLGPGTPLPGVAESPLHEASLRPGESVEFEANYSIPANFCSSSGNLQIEFFEPSRRGNSRATSLLSPAHYSVE